MSSAITSKCTVETQQQGATFKTIFSVMRFDDDFNVLISNTIEVMSMADVIVTMQPLQSPQYHLQVNVKLRKNIKAKSKNFSINIISDLLNKQFYCQDEWLDIALKSKNYDSFLRKYNNILLYTIKINFVVLAPTSDASSVCNKIYKELYEETEFTDFKLLAEDGHVDAHRSVLFIHSDMFQAMLKGKWKETGEGSIDMVGVTKQTLEDLKKYMYLGTIPNEGLEPLLLLAKYCLMDDLAAGCIEKLITNVKPVTFDALLELALQENIPELIKGLVLRLPDDVVNGIAKLNL